MHSINSKEITRNQRVRPVNNVRRTLVTLKQSFPKWSFLFQHRARRWIHFLQNPRRLAFQRWVQSIRNDQKQINKSEQHVKVCADNEQVSSYGARGENSNNKAKWDKDKQKGKVHHNKWSGKRDCGFFSKQWKWTGPDATGQSIRGG